VGLRLRCDWFRVRVKVWVGAKAKARLAPTLTRICDSQARWRGTIVAAKALKVDVLTDETAMSEFKTELALMQRLHHPHIVQVNITTPPVPRVPGVV